MSFEPAFVKQVTAGGSHTCAVLQNDQLKCFGKNDRGQLGYGDVVNRGDGQTDSMGNNLAFVDLGEGARVQTVATGREHTCVLLVDSRVKCFGGNQYGQLGYGDENDRGVASNQMGDRLEVVELGNAAKPLTITAGGFHTCVLFDNSRMKCFGRNFEGQLGLESSNDRGDGPNEMGNLNPFIDLGEDKLVSAMSLGSFFSCALLQDSVLKCFGEAQSGKLGFPYSQNQGDDAGEMGDALREVDLADAASMEPVLVASGGFHTCVVLRNELVSVLKCFGYNEFGQLGLGDVDNRGDQPGEMGKNLSRVDLGSFDNVTIQDLSLGSHHVCTRFITSSVVCFGRNAEGQLGYGDAEYRGDQPFEIGRMTGAVDFGENQNVTQIACGGLHTCAILDGGRLKCFGSSEFGQLGAGDTEFRGNDANEMGDLLPFVDLGDVILKIENTDNNPLNMIFVVIPVVVMSVVAIGYGFARFRRGPQAPPRNKNDDVNERV